MHYLIVKHFAHFLLTLLLALSSSFALAQSDSTKVNILAEINGEPITERELNQHIAQRTQGQTDLPAIQRQQFLQDIIDFTLLAQAGAAEGLDINPDVQAQLTNNRRSALAQVFLRTLGTADPITESVLRERYEAEYADQEVTEYRARHILVSEQEQAEGLIERLESGEEFAALAERHSNDGSAQRGGDLGWFARGDMVTPFADAVVELETGQITPTPIKTQFGWHVIELTDTRDAARPEFAEVSDQLRMTMLNERIQSQINQLRNNANIDYQATWAQPAE
ncbi:MAG: peptidylprolyl isomerase [Spiribacter sp.]|jgi:peptidyl-prolyl cis-trans isomerase C|nr:peptidylprolyl isomerase [Spiribacter sp.]MDR9489595.1 peptidylprolyl isomerase [Spiribacter sp.]